MSRALLFAGVVATTGCVISMDPTYYPLVDGSYSGSWDSLVSNDCFSSGLPIPHDYPLSFHAEVSDNAASLAWPALSDALAPMTGPMKGDGAFQLGAFVPHVLTSACTVAVTTDLRGMGISKSLVPFRLTVTFDAGTTAENGLPSDCSAFVGETVDDFPFPELSDPASGRCSVTVEGLGRRRY